MRYLAQLAYETTARLKPLRGRSWQPAMAPMAAMVEEQVVEWPAGGVAQEASGGEARSHAEPAQVGESPDDSAPQASRRAAAGIETRGSDTLGTAVDEEARHVRPGQSVPRRPSSAIGRAAGDMGSTEISEAAESRESAARARQSAVRLPSLLRAMEPTETPLEAHAREAQARNDHEHEETVSFLEEESARPRRMERAAIAVSQKPEGLSVTADLPERRGERRVTPEQRSEARVTSERVELASPLEPGVARFRDEGERGRNRQQEARPAPPPVTLKEILAVMAERQRELDAQQAREPQTRERREIEPGLRQRAPEFELQTPRAASQGREVRSRTDEGAHEVSLNIGSIVVRVEPEPVAPPRPAPPPPRAYSAPETSNFWARSFLDR
jgi:hypothetical protein